MIKVLINYRNPNLSLQKSGSISHTPAEPVIREGDEDESSSENSNGGNGMVELLIKRGGGQDGTVELLLDYGSIIGYRLIEGAESGIW